MQLLYLAFFYLIGSIPVAWLMGRLAGRGDIRDWGSGNAGVMNVALNVSRWAAILVMAAEAAKGLVTVLLAQRWQLSDTMTGLAIVAAVAGTCWPIWLKGRGGRGNTLGVAAMLVLTWPAVLIGVINLKQDGSMGTVQNSGNLNVYFLQEDFYGYSAVKPRSYQDIIETVNPVNTTLWRMLGVKYIIMDKPYSFEGLTPIYQSQNTFVFSNNNALPPIYFVDSVAQKPSIEILNSMKNNSFDPKKLAFANKVDFKFGKADSNSTAQIMQYKDESITVDVSTAGNNFLFFGTTFLPGWKALIDGSETKVWHAASPAGSTPTPGSTSAIGRRLISMIASELGANGCGPTCRHRNSVGVAVGSRSTLSVRMGR